MALKGFKQPLVQEDMWDLNEEDSTGYINQRFQHHTRTELAKARLRYQRQKGKSKEKAMEEDARNGVSNGMAKGVSQDVLMMVRRSTTVSFIRLFTSDVFSKQSALFKGEVGMKEANEKKKKKDKKKQKEDYPNSWLITTIYKTFKWILLKSAFFKLLQDVLSFVSPQLLK